MTYLKAFMENLRKRLRVVLASKSVVAVISVCSLIATLMFVKLIKNCSSVEYAEQDMLLYEALKGKKAVSVLFELSTLPMELLYPGVRVDLVQRERDELNYIVRDVQVVGVAVVDEGSKAKITLAVDDEESERVIKKEGSQLGLIVRGHGNSKDSDDIQIVEF